MGAPTAGSGTNQGGQLHAETRGTKKSQGIGAASITQRETAMDAAFLWKIAPMLPTPNTILFYTTFVSSFFFHASAIQEIERNN
jgi:hypothetical protein